MSVEELRAGFERLASTVVPEAQPYQQVLRRARRRRRWRRTRFGAAFAGLLVAGTTLVSPLGVGGGFPDGGWFGRGVADDGHPVTSDWAWQLIESPTRGNLAADSELVEELRAAARARSALPEARVLFVHEFAESRSAVVAHYSDTRASLSTFTARRGAGTGALVEGGGLRNYPVAPFQVVGDSTANFREGWSSDWLGGLAPAGCAVSTSGDATVDGTGGVRRSWQPAPTGDYVLAQRRPVGQSWQVSCAGTVRSRGPAGHGVAEASAYSPGPGPALDAWSGPVDQANATAAAGLYRELTSAAGLRAVDPVLRWSGTLVDAGRSQPAALIGPRSGPGPVVLHVGVATDALVGLTTRALDEPDEEETMAASRKDWSLVSTGTVGDAGLLATRLPERVGAHAVASDRLLVVPGPGAVRVEAVDAAGAVLGSAPVTGGAAVLPLPGQASAVRSVDGAGKTLARTSPGQFDPGRRLFGEELLSDW